MRGGAARTALLVAVYFLLGASAPEWTEQLPWLDLSAPDPELVVGGRVPLVEVRGRAGLGARAPIDVVLLFDVSDSALVPSGMDVDRDGEIGQLHAHGLRNAFGELRPTSRWTTDRGDTVLAAEIEAARRLLGRLEAAGTRVGIVTFAGRARIVQPVGDVRQALHALGDVRPMRDAAGTNLASGVRAALRALHRSARTHGRGRRQVVIALSDGQPTLPWPAIHARRYALDAAARAADQNVQIYGYAIGSQPEHARVLEEVALQSGGEFMHIRRVGEVLDHLPYAELGGIEGVSLHNRSSKAQGRAVRLFGDGTFDGFVPLVDGENLIEVQVRAKSGAMVRTLRTVHYDATSRALRAEEDLASLLRRRTVETELATRIRMRTESRHREVQVDTED